MDKKQAEATVQTTKRLNLTRNKSRKRYENRPFTKEQVRLIMLAVDNTQDAALLSLGFNTGCRVSEGISFIQDSIDWQQGQIKIWDEKKDKYRWIVPTLETMAKIKQHINTVKPRGNPIFNISKKRVERIIQKWAFKALGFKRSWHSVRTTYVSLSAEAEQSIAVVCQNTGDSPATIIEYYQKLSPDFMRKAVEAKPVYSEEKA